MKKIGIMGGTFDPVHNGHLYLAREALRQLSLDQVLWLTSGDPPHKGESVRSRVVRRNMTKLAIADLDGMEICDIEVRSEAEAYSCETLSALKAQHPDYELYFIMGEDSLRHFDSWYHPEIIAEKAKIVVAMRYESSDSQDEIEKRLTAIRELIEQRKRVFSTEFFLLQTKNIPVSSTALRQMIAKGESIRDYVPRAVEDYIKAHHLYEEEISYDKQIAAILPKLEKALKPSRFRHTLGVMETAASLAMRYSYPVSAARIAGLLHDCAKGNNDKELLALCKKYHLPVTEAEEASPHLLHAKVGAYLAKHTYKIKDEEICHAIAVHTTGEPGMGLLDPIIFVADYIEPNRNRAARLQEIREVAFFDLHLAVAMILKDTIQYLNKGNARIDAKTYDTYRSFTRTINPESASGYAHK